MSKVDTKNAHVRKGTVERKPKEPSQRALDAQRLLDDPAFDEALGTVREGIVNAISESKSDGSPEFDAAEREMCRTLRTLRSFKSVLTRTVQGEKLRLADFKGGQPTEDD